MIRTISNSLSLLSRKQVTGVFLLFVAALIVNALDVAAILVLGMVASIALGEQASLPFDALLPDVSESLAFWLGFAAGLFVSKTLFGLLISRAGANFIAKIEASYSEQIANQIFRGNSAHKDYSRAEIEWAILRSTAVAFGTVIGATFQLFAQGTLALSVVIIFFLIDPLSALLAVAYFALVLGVFQLASKQKSLATGSRYSSGSVTVGQAISDAISAAKDITILSKESFFIARISAARKQVAEAQAAQSYLQSIPRLVVELGLIVGAIGIVSVSFLTNDGVADLGLLSVFIVGSLRIMSALLPIQRAVTQLQFEGSQATLAQHLISEKALPGSHFSDKVEMGLDQRVASYPPEGGFEVELTNVEFSYEPDSADNPVVSDVTMKISEGKNVALIGPSGAGKSTIVELLLGLHEPSAGLVKISGSSPRRLREILPGSLGYVPQKPGLISGTIEANVAFGLNESEVDAKLLWEALAAAEIAPFVKSLPRGVKTHIGHESVSLSGGQAQRIGLARALYNKPRLLVLDEATSALDAETEGAISSTLRRLGNATTTVVVAHRLSTVQNADEVYLIESGRIRASGTFAELMKNSPLVKRYVDLMKIT